MTYTTNTKYLEEDLLPRLGVDVEDARRVVLTGSPGFTVNLSSLPAQQVFIVQGQLRTALYSWLRCLGVKKEYAIKLGHMAVQVSKRVNIPAEHGYIPGVFAAVGRGGTTIMSEAEGSGVVGVEDPEEAQGIMDILEGRFDGAGGLGSSGSDKLED